MMNSDMDRLSPKKSRLIDVNDYHEFVPGILSDRICSHNWAVPRCESFVLPSVLDEGPIAPALDHHILSVQDWGLGPRKLFCRIDGNIAIEKKIIGEAFKVAIFPRFNSIFWSWRNEWELDSSMVVGTTGFYFPHHYLEEAIEEVTTAYHSNVELLPNPDFSDPFLVSLLQSIRSALKKNDPIDRLYAETCTKMISVYLLKNFCSTTILPMSAPDGLGGGALKRVIEYINDNLVEDISLGELAAVANISRFHFTRLFKRSLGETPYHYLVSQRIKKSKFLLRHSQQSVTGIALEVGYNNVSHFASTFKRFTGSTPTKYRKAYQ